MLAKVPVKIAPDLLDIITNILDVLVNRLEQAVVLVVLLRVFLTESAHLHYRGDRRRDDRGDERNRDWDSDFRGVHDP